MKFTGPATPRTRGVTLLTGLLVLSAALLAAMLVFAPTPVAQAYSPCPAYSIQDVFDDPDSNWDNDQVRNADELYNGLNPCKVDTNEFCSGGGNPLCIYPTYTYSYYPTACQTAINTSPGGDYDGDGISNSTEVRNGANPCAHPCPHPTGIDLALNPNGSWDNDGISNAIEVSQGTNPCNGYAYNPCPYYSLYHVDHMPGYDWDNDGVSNRNEVYRGTNPCVYNAPIPHVVVYQQPTQRLPHVNTPAPQVVHVAPTPVRPACPAGYPYYHPDTRLCYANPVTTRWF